MLNFNIGELIMLGLGFFLLIFGYACFITKRVNFIQFVLIRLIAFILIIIVILTMN